MQSGDGLVFRVRPRKAQVTAYQAMGLAELALRYGSGAIDLTNRANLQIRGVSGDDTQAMIEGLTVLGLLDPDPRVEMRRNILMAPFWQQGDDTDRLETRLVSGLSSLPEMPAKIGYAIDTETYSILGRASADFRFERGEHGLVLRADGCALGRSITVDTAMDALQDMAEWFVKRRGDDRRMAAVVQRIGLPEEWQTDRPNPAQRVPELGVWDQNGDQPYTLFGATYGQIEAKKLIQFAQQPGVETLRITPWRMLAVEHGENLHPCGLLTKGEGAALNIRACIGAPNCPQASVATREPWLKQVRPANKIVHISGCDKGCAHPKPADVVLVGRDGAFDLVCQGTAWDSPVETGLSLKEALKRGGIR